MTPIGSGGNLPPQSSSAVDWRVIVGVGIGLFAVGNTFSNPLQSEEGAMIWLAFMVGLPGWVLIKTRHNAVKNAMIAVIAFAALITVAPSSPSIGTGSGCHVEWDGRNNPEVCD